MLHFIKNQLAIQPTCAETDTQLQVPSPLALASLELELELELLLLVGGGVACLQPDGPSCILGGAATEKK